MRARKPIEIPDNKMDKEDDPPPLKCKAQARSVKQDNVTVDNALADIQKGLVEIQNSNEKWDEMMNGMATAIATIMNRLDVVEAKQLPGSGFSSGAGEAPQSIPHSQPQNYIRSASLQPPAPIPWSHSQ